MADEFIGEIRIFAGNFAPQGWEFCKGQVLPISQNTALFSIIGNRYGGDGATTFALPNLSDSAPLHYGAGPGLTPRSVGEHVGQPTVTLTRTSIPSHSHKIQASTAEGSTGNPAASVFAESPPPERHAAQEAMYSTTPDATLNEQALSGVGNGQPHNNMQPYLGLSYIIATEGEYPHRN